jgi:hypothetical protein
MHEQPEQHSTACADYVGQLSLQLAQISRAHGLDQVATLLEMAAIEAETLGEELQPGKRPRGNDRRPNVSRDRPNHVHGG